MAEVGRPLPHTDEEKVKEEEEKTSSVRSSSTRLSTSLCSSTTCSSSSFSSCDAETGTHSAFIVLPVHFLDKVLDMPVVVLRQVLQSMVQKTVVVPQLQSIDGRRHSLRSAEAEPHGPDCSADH